MDDRSEETHDSPGSQLASSTVDNALSGPNASQPSSLRLFKNVSSVGEAHSGSTIEPTMAKNVRSARIVETNRRGQQRSMLAGIRATL